LLPEADWRLWTRKYNDGKQACILASIDPKWSCFDHHSLPALAAAFTANCVTLLANTAVAGIAM
jgi:predicted secreted Zn-dependent protease